MSVTIRMHHVSLAPGWSNMCIQGKRDGGMEGNEIITLQPMILIVGKGIKISSILVQKQ